MARLRIQLTPLRPLIKCEWGRRVRSPHLTNVSPVPALLLMVTLTSLLSCGVASSTIGPGDPTQTVQSAYTAANAGNYAQADSYLSPELKAIEQQDGGSRVVWDANTRNRTLTTFSAPTATTNTPDARVSAKLAFRDGCVQTLVADLRQNANVWNITRLSTDPVNPITCGTHGAPSAQSS